MELGALAMQRHGIYSCLRLCRIRRASLLTFCMRGQLRAHALISDYERLCPEPQL